MVPTPKITSLVSLYLLPTLLIKPSVGIWANGGRFITAITIEMFLSKIVVSSEPQTTCKLLHADSHVRFTLLLLQTPYDTAYQVYQVQVYPYEHVLLLTYFLPLLFQDSQGEMLPSL